MKSIGSGVTILPEVFINKLSGTCDLEQEKAYFSSLGKSLDVLLAKRDESGMTIGHHIAKRKGLHELMGYFLIVETYSNINKTKLLMAKDNRGRHIGHVIARYKKKEAFENYLEFVKKHSPDILPLILTDKTDTGSHMGLYIALYPPHESLLMYFTLLKEFAPQDLDKIIVSMNCRGRDILNAYVKLAAHASKNQMADYCPSLYFLLTSCSTMPKGKLQSIADDWEGPLFHYINKTLKGDEQKLALAFAVTPGSLLNIFFNCQKTWFANDRYYCLLHDKYKKASVSHFKKTESNPAVSGYLEDTSCVDLDFSSSGEDCNRQTFKSGF